MAGAGRVWTRRLLQPRPARQPRPTQRPTAATAVPGPPRGAVGADVADTLGSHRLPSAQLRGDTMAGVGETGQHLVLVADRPRPRPDAAGDPDPNPLRLAPSRRCGVRH